MIEPVEPQDVIALPDGSILTTHARERCQEPCSIHAPSDHPLRDAEQVWIGTIGILARRCQHAIVHPDPDDLLVREPLTGAMIRQFHEDCDGCCGVE